MSVDTRSGCAALMLVVIALVATGCGGSSAKTASASAKAGTRTTKAKSTQAGASSQSIAFIEFIDEGDNVCAFHYVSTPFTKVDTHSESRLKRTARHNVSVERLVLSRLRKVKLTAPASVAGYWREFLADREVFIGDWLEIAKHGLRGTDRHILESLHNTQESMLLAARNAGFLECQEFA